jgi:hypothetical protein
MHESGKIKIENRRREDHSARERGKKREILFY